MLMYIQVKHREDSFNVMGYTPEDKKLDFYEQFNDCSFFVCKNKKGCKLNLHPLLLFYHLFSKHSSNQALHKHNHYLGCYYRVSNTLL